jgi:dGTPase
MAGNGGKVPAGQPYRDFNEYRMQQESQLPPWACRFKPGKSRLGKPRDRYEERLGYRTEFQVDRDDIVYSPSFRQLAYKRQMFSSPGEESFYTRLTHTLIVSQIARSVSRGLQLDEHLAEAIALAHDLGHSPYGHAGEDGINRFLTRALFPNLVEANKGEPDRVKRITIEERLKKEQRYTLGRRSVAAQQYAFDWPRPLTIDDLETEFLCLPTDTKLFDHHRQGYRIVSMLERDGSGLGLCLETYYGILRASGDSRDDDAFLLSREQLSTEFASFEAQVVRIADDIAWANHDLTEDCRKTGQKPEELLREYRAKFGKEGLEGNYEDMLDFLRTGSGERYGRFITDLIRTNSGMLRQEGYASQQDGAPGYVIGLSPELQMYLNSMKKIVVAVIHESDEMKDIAASATREIERICLFLLEPDNLRRFVAPSLYAGFGSVNLPLLKRCRIVVDAVAMITDYQAYEFVQKHFVGYRRPRRGVSAEWLNWPLTA